MIRLPAVFCLLFFLLSPAFADSVYIVLSEDSESYHQAGSNIESRLQQQGSSLAASVTLLNQFDQQPVQDDDLIVTIGADAARYISTHFPGNSQLYSYINKSALPDSPPDNWAAVLLDQPVQRLVDTAEKIITGRYRNKLVMAVSENNRELRDEISQLDIGDNIELEVLVIEANAEPAKIIDKALFNAGALIALRDQQIWSGKTAKWMLYQSYKYNVPVIGYSKSFLKAGALVSVYAELDKVTNTTAELIGNWQKNQGTLTPAGVLYPPYSIDYNKNIARALKIPIPDSIATDEQTDVRD